MMILYKGNNSSISYTKKPIHETEGVAVESSRSLALSLHRNKA